MIDPWEEIPTTWANQAGSMHSMHSTQRGGPKANCQQSISASIRRRSKIILDTFESFQTSVHATIHQYEPSVNVEIHICTITILTKLSRPWIGVCALIGLRMIWIDVQGRRAPYGGGERRGCISFLDCGLLFCHP